MQRVPKEIIAERCSQIRVTQHGAHARGASREEQQILGAQVFPIPIKHGSRNGRIKQETPHTIDKTKQRQYVGQ